MNKCCSRIEQKPGELCKKLVGKCPSNQHVKKEDYNDRCVNYDCETQESKDSCCSVWVGKRDIIAEMRSELESASSNSSDSSDSYGTCKTNWECPNTWLQKNNAKFCNSFPDRKCLSLIHI